MSFRRDPPETTPFLEDSFLALLPNYTRGVATPTKIWERIDGFLEPKIPRPTDARFHEVYRHAKTILLCEIVSLLNGSLTPCFPKQAVEALPTSTSAGFPYVMHGLSKKKDAAVFALRRSRRVGTTWNMPCLVATRLQTAEITPECPSGKTRLVWNMPFDYLIHEKRFYEPLFLQIRDSPLFGWHYDWLSGKSKAFYDRYSLKHIHDLVWSADFSKYDERLPSWLIRDVFTDILRPLYTLDEKNQAIWNAMVDYIVDTPLMCGRWVVKSRGGMPSGSAWTQLVDSLVNILMNLTSLMMLSEVSDPISYYHSIKQICDITVLGDDSIVRPLIPWRVQGLFRHHTMLVSKYFGAQISEKKSIVLNAWLNHCIDDDSYEVPKLHFLGKWITAQHVYADEVAVLQSLIYPEDSDTEPGDLLTRIIGLMWTSGNDYIVFSGLESAYQSVVKRYPEATPTPWKRSDLVQFRFAFLQTGQPPPLVLPSFLDVAYRYNKLCPPFCGVKRKTVLSTLLGT